VTTDCGLFGVWDLPHAAQRTYLGLFALQHRGQEAAGIVTTDGRRLYEHRGQGLVADVFGGGVLDRLPGRSAVGHTRYSTTGSSSLANAQPFVAVYSRGELAIAHNGNLVNARALRQELEATGAIFRTTMDTEIIAHLMARPGPADLREEVLSALKELRGAFSLVMLTPQALIGVRDPKGWRPLVLGELDGRSVLASETCALDMVGARLIREMEPGEAVFIDGEGMEACRLSAREQVTPTYCMFEHVYFARPDSQQFGDSVYEVRCRLGEALARDYPVDGDVVIGVPDGGTFAAGAYARARGLPVEQGIIRSHYIGRTFIEPSPTTRTASVQLKMSVVREAVAGRRVIVVEDSLVRGTTSMREMHALRQAGAREVHFLITCPPHRYPCYFGIDFPTSEELIAHDRTTEEVAALLGVDSLYYQSLEALLAAGSQPADHYCTACWTGKYPVPIEEPVEKFAFEATPGADTNPAPKESP
jgi:amidophosphoribosyltransferase